MKYISPKAFVPNADGSMSYEARRVKSEVYIYSMIRGYINSKNNQIRNGDPTIRGLSLSRSGYKALRQRFFDSFQTVDGENVSDSLIRDLDLILHDTSNPAYAGKYKHLMNAITKTFTNLDDLELPNKRDMDAIHTFSTLADIPVNILWDRAVYAIDGSTTYPNREQDWYTYISPLDPVYMDGNSTVEKDKGMHLYMVRMLEGEYIINGKTIHHHDISSNISVIRKKVYKPRPGGDGTQFDAIREKVPDFYSDDDLYNISWLKPYASPQEISRIRASMKNGLDPAMTMPTVFNKYGERIMSYLEENGYEYSVVPGKRPGQVDCVINGSSNISVRIMDTHYAYGDDGKIAENATSNLNYLGRVYVNKPFGIEYYWNATSGQSFAERLQPDRINDFLREFTPDVALIPLRYALGEKIERVIDGQPLGSLGALQGTKQSRNFSYCVADEGKNNRTVNMAYNRYMTLHGASLWHGKSAGAIFYSDEEVETWKKTHGIATNAQISDVQAQMDNISNEEYFESELNIENVIQAAKLYESDNTVLPKYSDDERIQAMQRNYFYYLTGQIPYLDNVSPKFGEEFGNGHDLKTTIESKKQAFSSEDEEFDSYNIYQYTGLVGLPDSMKAIPKYVYLNPETRTSMDITYEEYQSYIEANDKNVMLTYLTPYDDEYADYNTAYDDSMESEYGDLFEQASENRENVVREHILRMEEYSKTMDFDSFLTRNIMVPKTAEEFLRDSIHSAKMNVYELVDIDGLAEIAMKRAASDNPSEYMPVYSDNDIISDLQHVYFNYFTSNAGTLMQPGSFNIPYDMSNLDFMTSDTESIGYKTQAAYYHLQETIDTILIGDYDKKFDPGHVAAFSSDKTVYANSIMKAMYTLNLDVDRVLNPKDAYNQSICDGLVHFDETSAVSLKDLDSEPDSFKKRMLKMVYDTLDTNACKVDENDIRIDENGIVEYKAYRQYGQYQGSATDRQELITGHFGQIFEPNELGVIYTKYHASDQRVYIPGYNAHVLPRKDEFDDSSMYERMRLIGYEQMMSSQIRKILRASIIADNSVSQDDVQAFNYVYHHMPCDVFTVDEFESRMHDPSEETADMFRATVRTMTKKLRLPNAYKENATMQAQAKVLDGKSRNANFEDDILAGRVQDSSFDYRYWNRTGHNICEIANYADDYVDKDLTSTGTNQGAILYMTDSTTVNPDGSLTKGEAGDRTAVMKTELMKYCEFDGSDRVTMAGMQAMTAKRIMPKVKTAMIPLNGWGYDDAFIITKDFAEKAQFMDDNGHMRSVRVGDKLADAHGNKGVVSLIVDRDMSDKDADERGIREVRDFMRENPELECVVSPYSGPSRNNGGTLRELYDSNHLDLVIPADKNHGRQVIKEGIGELNIVVTDKLVDEKSHIYSSSMDKDENDMIFDEMGDEITRDNHNSRGRKLSAQLAMAFTAKDCKGILAEAYGPNMRNFKDAQDYISVLGMTLDDNGHLSMREQTDELDADDVIVRLPEESPTWFSSYERDIFEYEKNPDGTYKLDGKNKRIKVMEQAENGTMVPKKLRTVMDYKRRRSSSAKNVLNNERVMKYSEIISALSEKLSVKSGCIELPFPLIYPNENGVVGVPYQKNYVRKNEDGSVTQMTMNDVLKSGDMEQYERALSEMGYRYTKNRGEDYIVGKYTDEARGQEHPGVAVPTYRIPLLSENLRNGILLANDDYMAHDYTIQYRQLLNAALKYVNLVEAEDYMKNYFVPAKIEDEIDVDIKKKREAIRKESDVDKRKQLENEMAELKESKLADYRAAAIDKIHSDMAAIVRSAQNDYNSMAGDILNKRFLTKHNLMRENLMARYAKNSATMVWTPNPTLDINQVGFGATNAAKMGLSEDQVIVLWRDPLLAPGNVRGMKVHILPDDIDGISIHPLIDKSFDGDFDGDSAGIFVPETEAAEQDAITKLGQEYNLADTTTNRANEHPLYLNDGMETTPNLLANPELVTKRDQLQNMANIIASSDIHDAQTQKIAEDALQLANEYTKDVMKGIAGDYISFDSPQAMAEGVKRFSVSGAKGNVAKGHAYLVNCVGMNVDAILENGQVMPSVYGDAYNAVIMPQSVDTSRFDASEGIIYFDNPYAEPFDAKAFVSNHGQETGITESMIQNMVDNYDFDMLAAVAPEFGLYYNAHKVTDFDPGTAVMRNDDETGISLDMRNVQQKAQGIKTFDTALAGTQLQKFMVAFRGVLPQQAMEITRGSTHGVLQSKHNAAAAVEKDSALRYWIRDILAGKKLVNPNPSENKMPATMADAFRMGLSPEDIRSVNWRAAVISEKGEQACGLNSRVFDNAHKTGTELTPYIYADKQTSIDQLKAYITAMDAPMNEDYVEEMFEVVYNNLEEYKTSHADEYSGSNVPEWDDETNSFKPVFVPSINNYMDVYGSTMDKIAYGDHWREFYKAAEQELDIFAEKTSNVFKPSAVKQASKTRNKAYDMITKALAHGYELESRIPGGKGKTVTLSEVLANKQDLDSGKVVPLDMKWRKSKEILSNEDESTGEKREYDALCFMTQDERISSVKAAETYIFPYGTRAKKDEFVEKKMKPFIEATMSGKTVYTVQKDKYGNIKYQTVEDANGNKHKEPIIMSYHEFAKAYNAEHKTKQCPREAILGCDWTTKPGKDSVAKKATKSDMTQQYSACFRVMGMPTSATAIKMAVDKVCDMREDRSLIRYLESATGHPWKNGNVFTMRRAVNTLVQSNQLDEKARERTLEMESYHQARPDVQDVIAAMNEQAKTGKVESEISEMRRGPLSTSDTSSVPKDDDTQYGA